MSERTAVAMVWLGAFLFGLALGGWVFAHELEVQLGLAGATEQAFLVLFWFGVGYLNWLTTVGLASVWGSS